MKLHSTFSIGLCCWMLFSLFSCVNEVNTTLPEDDPNTLETDAYFSLSLAAGEMVETRADNIPDAKNGEWEYRVSEVWVLLYGKNDSKLKYHFTYHVSNYNDKDELINFKDGDDKNPAVVENKGEKLKFVSIAEIIKRDHYRMLVLANPGTSFSAPAIGSALSDFDKELKGVEIDDFGGEEGSNRFFFMSNANGLIAVAPSDLQTTAAEAEGKPVKVSIDRLLAKVIVKEKDGGTKVPDKVTLDSKSLRWYLDVVNTNTYIYRRFAMLEGGAVKETEENSADTHRSLQYAADPNFTEDKMLATDFVRGELKTPWVAAAPDPSNTLPTYQYVFENTMDKEAQKGADWKDYTTQIVLEANLIYTDFLTDADDPDDPGRYYYSYKPTTETAKTFSHAQVKYWLKWGFPAEMPGLKTLIESHMEERKNGNDKTFDFSADNPDKTITSCTTYSGITYHPMGLNIYRMPIKHFKPKGDSKPQENIYGYFGVVRNNVYTVTINSLNGPGSNEVLPDDPFISADITITQWYERRFQQEDLGYD